MLATYDLDGQPADSLDLKCLLIGTGMRYPARVHEAVAERARLEPPSNPYACNCVILPGEVAVHLTVDDASPFALDLDDEGRACLFHRGQHLTEVSFPLATTYYGQRTHEGRPFGACAVLEGTGLLAFFYLWRCEYIDTGETCEFCFQARAEMAGFELPSPSDAEVAEIIAWGIEHAGVKQVQLTAGSKFSSSDECRRYARLFEVIDRQVGLDRIPTEIYCYATAPARPGRGGSDSRSRRRPRRARPAGLGPQAPRPHLPRSREARRPRRSTPRPGARRRQVRPEPCVQLLRRRDRALGLDDPGRRVLGRARHRPGVQRLDASRRVDRWCAPSAGPGLLPPGPPRICSPVSQIWAQPARTRRRLARVGLPRHLSLCRRPPQQFRDVDFSGRPVATPLPEILRSPLPFIRWPC